MSTVMEIEAALRQLPLKDAQAIAEWLRIYLNEEGHLHNARAEQDTPSELNTTARAKKTSSVMTAATVHTPIRVRLPDYAARRRMILGDKVLPNMVLLAREQVLHI